MSIRVLEEEIYKLTDKKYDIFLASKNPPWEDLYWMIQQNKKRFFKNFQFYTKRNFCVQGKYIPVEGRK